MAPRPLAVPDDVPEHWKPAEGGSNYVAIPAHIYEAKSEDVEGFFGRRLAKWSHNLTRPDDRKSFVVFNFKEKADADKFMQAFEGEPFDPRDKGNGQHWMLWSKGKAAKRDKKRR